MDCTDYQSSDLRIMLHHIYEYKKGVRNMVLQTLKAQDYEKAEELLIKKNIDYIIERVSLNKINIFFGDSKCIDILSSFDTLELNKLTDEQDFMLGIMLGYNVNIQFDRYLKRKDKGTKLEITKSAF